MLLAQIKKTYWTWLILSLAICLLILSPIISTFTISTNSDPEIWIHLKNTVLNDYILNTFYLSISTLCLSIIFGYFPAYYLSIYQIKYDKLIDLFFSLPLTIPSYVMAYTYGDLFSYTGDFYQIGNFLFGTGFRDTFYIDFFNFFNLALVLSFSFFPYIFLSARTYFETLNKNIIDSAKSLGKSRSNIFWKILIPLSLPAIGSGGLLVTMEVFNEYGAVKYFGFPTLTSGVFRAWQGMGSINAATNISAYFTLIVVIILLFNYLINRKKRFNNSSQYKFKKENMELSQKFIFYSLVLIIPFFSLLIPFSFIFKNFLNNINRLADLLEVFLNTLTLGIISAIIVLLFSNILVFNNKINNGLLSNFFIGISKFAYSIPGAVLSVGFLALFMVGFNISMIGLTFLILALSIRFIAPAFSQIENSQKVNSMLPYRSALSLGKSSFDLFGRLHLKDALILNLFAFVIVLVDISKELPLTLILRPFNFDTLATKTFDYANDELLEISSVPSFFIVIIGIFSFILIRNYSFGNSINK